MLLNKYWYSYTQSLFFQIQRRALKFFQRLSLAEKKKATKTCQTFAVRYFYNNTIINISIFAYLGFPCLYNCLNILYFAIFWVEQKKNVRNPAWRRWQF